MGVELKRPVWAFAVVSVLCAVLMIVSTGRVDAVLGVFDAPKPIFTPTHSSPPAPADVRAETPAAVTVPDELTAKPVGAAKHSRPAPATAPEQPQSPGKSGRTGKTDRKTDRKADRKVDRLVDKATDRASDKKAGKAAAKAVKKAGKAAAKALKKADKAAAKALKNA